MNCHGKNFFPAGILEVLLLASKVTATSVFSQMVRLQTSLIASSNRLIFFVSHWSILTLVSADLAWRLSFAKASLCVVDFYYILSDVYIDIIVLNTKHIFLFIKAL